MADFIKDDLEIYPAEWLIEAMDLALAHNARKWSYVQGILKNWEKDGKRTGAKPKIKLSAK